MTTTTATDHTIAALERITDDLLTLIRIEAAANCNSALHEALILALDAASDALDEASGMNGEG
jgi:hypothetical protein